MAPRSMIDVCIHRVSQRPLLELHEHEVSRLAGELAGSSWDSGLHRARTSCEVEIELRSQAATFYGRPVRCI